MPSKFNFNDYCLLPEDGKRYEIIDGELHNAPAPTVAHQRIVMRLLDILYPYCNENKHGELLVAPVDVLFSEIDVVQPDILWVSNERLSIITEKNIQGSPDLVVEIVSPSTARKDRELKVKLYEKFKVAEYWLVDPGMGSVSVFRLSGDGLDLVGKHSDLETLESPLFPGLKVDLSVVLARS